MARCNPASFTVEYPYSAFGKVEALSGSEVAAEYPEYPMMYVTFNQSCACFLAPSVSHDYPEVANISSYIYPEAAVCSLIQLAFFFSLAFPTHSKAAIQ